MLTLSTLSHVLDWVILNERIIQSWLECTISLLQWQVSEAEMVLGVYNKHDVSERDRVDICLTTQQNKRT